MDTRILEIILRARDEASAAVEKATSNIAKSFDKAKGASALFIGGLAAAGAAVAGLTLVGANYAGQMESLEAALTTVAGSAEAAHSAMATIVQTAKDSPFFDTATLAQFVQTMTAAGLKINDAVKSGLKFGDVMAAFGKGNAELTRLGNTLSQVMGKGKADIVDFKELVNSGWTSVRRDVSEAMGISIDKFDDMVSAGLIGYDQIAAAAGKFAGAADRQSNTWGAILQRMQESFQSFLGKLVVDTGIFDKLKEAINGVITFMDEHGDEMAAFVKDAMQWAIDNWPIVIGIIVGGMIPTLYALAGAFVANTIALLPFMAIAMAVAYVAKYIIDNWGPLTSFFTTLWTTVTGVFQTVVDWFREKIDWFKDHWAEAIGFVIGFFATLPFTLPFLVATAIYKIIELLAKIDWGAVFASIGVAFGKVWDTIKATAINVFNYLKSINWGELLSNIGRGIGNAIIGLIEGAIKGATAGIPVIGDAMKNLHIPRFEKGIENFSGGLAYVHQGEVLANLAPGTTVIPKDEVNGRMGGVNITIHANVSKEVDIQQLGQRLAWEMKLAGGF